MIFIDRTETNPYFNIAAEEYVLHNFNEDVLMLWESKKSVVLGKHQNAFAEVNYPFLIKNRIPLIRRISGGGTVFHGNGNLNITVIRNSATKFGQVNFKQFTIPIISFLQQYGIEVVFEGKNNLRIGGKKISGNSAHIFKNRVMHHGTILFNADLIRIDEIVNAKPHCFHDRAIKSIRTVVVNLSEYFPEETNFGDFKEALKKYLLKELNITKIQSFSKHDKIEILRLMQEKYKSWKWNFGYSPTFDFRNEIIMNGKKIKCFLKIKNAIIQDAEISEEGNNYNSLEQKLLLKKFSQISIRTVLLEAGLSKDIVDAYLKLFNLA